MADAEPAVSPADATTTEPRRPPPWPTWGDVLEWVLPDRRRLLGVAAAVLVLVGSGLTGYLLLRTPPAPATELTLPFAGSSPGAGEPQAGPATSTTVVAADLVVHAAGAVAGPGVHRVPAGSRVADLLAAAGGPLPDTDLDRVNLAAGLSDGERVWFPRVGEEAPPLVTGGGSGGGASGSASDRSGPIDINTATAEELDTLPGVGPAIAASIIEHRERNGPFASVDGLLDVPGIGDAKLAELRDLVTV